MAPAEKSLAAAAAGEVGIGDLRNLLRRMGHRPPYLKQHFPHEWPAAAVGARPGAGPRPGRAPSVRWTPSHYDLLGVSKGATDLEIRSAYLRLIKLRHPDREDRSDWRGGSAADLNAAYWVLRDPVRRSRYDQSLQGEDPALIPRVIPVFDPPSSSRIGWPYELLAAGALLAAVTGLVMFGQQQVDEKGRVPGTAVHLSDPGRDIADKPTAASPNSANLNEDSMAAAVAAALAVSPEEAADHSSRCFDTLAGSAELKLLDYCLAFDESVAALHPALSASANNLGYFTLPVRRSREAQALSRFSGRNYERHERLVAIEAESIARLAANLSGRAMKEQ